MESDNHTILEDNGYKTVEREELPQCFKLGGFVQSGNNTAFVPTYCLPIKIENSEIYVLSNDMDWISLANSTGKNRFYTRSNFALVDYKWFQTTFNSGKFNFVIKESDEGTILREYTLFDIL